MEIARDVLEARSSVPSAFDIVMDRTLTVMQSGKPREVTVEEALQHRTYQDAIAGNRAAQREVLKMIDRREKWLAAKRPKQQQDRRVADRADGSSQCR